MRIKMFRVKYIHKKKEANYRKTKKRIHDVINIMNLMKNQI